MRCSECGFRLDPVNESQQVCPACGRDPIRCEGAEEGLGIPAALGAVGSMADHLPASDQCKEEGLAVGAEVDYLPDPELDLMMAEAEAYIKALFEGPILVAGNQLIN